MLTFSAMDFHLYVEHNLLKEQCEISCTHPLTAAFPSSLLSWWKSWWIRERYNLLSSLYEFGSWVHVKSNHSIPPFFPSKPCEISFSTVWCKFDYLHILRPQQENWSQPLHGHVAFMKGYWRKSSQRGSYVQSPPMRYGAAGWVSTFLVLTCSIHSKLPT